MNPPAVTGSGPPASAPAPASAHPATCCCPPRRRRDYKALVCVFLYGGNDGLNTIIADRRDASAQYAAVRKTLALPQASLIGLGSSGYGLHPSLAALAPALGEGPLAPVFNLGPLCQPLTRRSSAPRRRAPSSCPTACSRTATSRCCGETANDALTRTGWGGRAAEGASRPTR